MAAPRGNYTAPFDGDKPTQSTFRGTWQPVLYRPAFNAYAFLPTPPPQQARRRPPSEKEREPEPEPEPKPEEPPGELLTEPPIPPEEVLLSVMDREKNYRACVAKDGTCTNNRGQVIGFLNLDAGEAGTAGEDFLGNVVESHFDNVYQVRDATEELCGWIDMGTATIRDAAGSTVADVGGDGVIAHANGTYLGVFRLGRAHGARMVRHHLKEIALYVVLIDPGMLSDVAG